MGMLVGLRRGVTASDVAGSVVSVATASKGVCIGRGEASIEGVVAAATIGVTGFCWQAHNPTHSNSNNPPKTPFCLHIDPALFKKLFA